MIVSHDRAGMRFGRLEVISYSHTKNQKKYWLCSCVCGGKTTVSSGNLTTGSIVSCGCSKISHNLSEHKTYRSWHDMKQRCGNKNNTNYCNYGGRGIKVCGRWINSFENFNDDMGLKESGLTLERLDVNGNYEPNNCVWDSRSKQMHNRRISNSSGHRNILIHIDKKGNVNYSVSIMREGISYRSKRIDYLHEAIELSELVRIELYGVNSK